MLYLKKYFTEGLIQMAILLSLCGVRVDVGLDSYLSPTWQEMILGPTSALTQTQFHNLRNRLDSQSTHPKNVDLDGFFTTRRLLGWLHSLDRLQVGVTPQSPDSPRCPVRILQDVIIFEFALHRFLRQSWRRGWSRGSKILSPGGFQNRGEPQLGLKETQLSQMMTPEPNLVSSMKKKKKRRRKLKRYSKFIWDCTCFRFILNVIRNGTFYFENLMVKHQR